MAVSQQLGMTKQRVVQLATEEQRLGEELRRKESLLNRIERLTCSLESPNGMDKQDESRKLINDMREQRLRDELKLRMQEVEDQSRQLEDLQAGGVGAAHARADELEVCNEEMMDELQRLNLLVSHQASKHIVEMRAMMQRNQELEEIVARQHQRQQRQT